MGMIGGVLVAILIAAAARQAADEFKAWTPALIRWLIGIAVAKMPPESRERYGEEWAGHICETPGEIGKLIAAAGFYRGALSAIRVPAPQFRNLIASFEFERRVIGDAAIMLVEREHLPVSAVDRETIKSSLRSVLSLSDILRLRWWGLFDYSTHSVGLGTLTQARAIDRAISRCAQRCARFEI